MAVKAAHPRAMRPHASRFIFSEPHSLIVASQTRRAEATNVTLRRHGVTATICCSRTLNDADTLAFAPRLPGGLTRLSFTVVRRNIRLRVGVTALMASYQLLIEHGGLDILHYGERIKLDGRNSWREQFHPRSCGSLSTSRLAVGLSVRRIEKSGERGIVPHEMRSVPSPRRTMPATTRSDSWLRWRRRSRC